jgi:predicted signal transduction protein with EAL and GGDEF domain
MGSDSERECDLVRSTIELGHAMGLRIVAEGIEDRATLDLLTRLGCDVAQGYFISRPKPANQLVFRPQLSVARPQTALGRGADPGADPDADADADPGYFGLERRGLAR